MIALVDGNMEKKKEPVYLDDLTGAELLDLILEDSYTLCESPTEPLRDEDKAQAKAVARRLLKKMREKEERAARAAAKEDKKIAFLLEGDRLKEAERCARYRRFKEWSERHALANRNNDSGGGGSSVVVRKTTTSEPPRPVSKFCSTCGFSHP